MHLRQSLSLCALLAVAALSGGRAAFAGTTYLELGNTGTQITTDFSTATQSTINLTNPYGGHLITPVGGGYLLAFSPTTAFKASATGNDSGGMRVETDGKITFTLTFDAPIHLAASITEGGQFLTTGAGSLATIAGGIVVETVDGLGHRETIGGTSNFSIFNNDGTWTSTIDLGAFTGSYTTYKFSIDNYLRADALAPGSAWITKDNFSISIPPEGGTPSLAPLPLAALSGSALSGLLLLFRKRLTRSIA